jgi:hypothetical protein
MLGLSFVGITIAFAVSLGFDYVIIVLLNWLFGSAFAVGSIAGTIYSLIQDISYLGAVILYILTVLLLLSLYIISSWKTTKKDSKPLKSRVDQLLQDTIRVLISALRLFLIFVMFIIFFAVCLFLISWVLSQTIPIVETLKIFTVFIVVIAYVVYVSQPLWEYGKDIFHKLFEKPDEQEDSKT